jgi:hypothetical protein
MSRKRKKWRFFSHSQVGSRRSMSTVSLATSGAFLSGTHREGGEGRRRRREEGEAS